MKRPRHMSQISGSIRRALWAALACSFLITNPATAQISLVGHLEPSTTTQYGDVWGYGDYAYLGTRANQGVFIIDVSDPTDPFVASQYIPSSGSSPQDVKVENGIGYFATDNGGGIDIVDLADPTNPRLLSHIPGRTHNLFVSNGLLYKNNMTIWNVRDPENPVMWHNIGGGAHDVTVLGDRLYESNFGTGTTIYDVSTVTESQPPAMIARIPTGSSSHSAWTTTDGNILANARETGNGDVGIFDISDPQNPSLLARLFEDDFTADRAFSPHNPIIVGDHLYVSWYEVGLQVFDISDPANPKHAGRFDTSRNWGVYPFLGPDRVLLSDMNDGLFIVNVEEVLDSPHADFNDDQAYDCADVDQLTAAIGAGVFDAKYDLTGDGLLNSNDLEAWLRIAGTTNLQRQEPSLRYRRYVAGDANLDGFVDGADFILWNANRFQQGGWCDGDFNADGVVDPQDFLVWYDNRFATPSPRIVPEPSTLLSLAVMLLFPCRRMR